MLAALFAPLVSIAVVGAAHAQTTELQSARAAAMGGAFRAIAFDNSAIDLNPAGMAQVARFEFDGGYYRAQAAGAYAIGTSLTDSLTNRAATGFAFEHRKVNRSGTALDLSSQRYVTAVAFPVVPERVFFGLNAKYFRVAYGKGGPRDGKGWTSDVGLLYRPLPILAIGATLDNLVNGNQPEAPRTATGGAVFLPFKWLMVSGDLFHDMASAEEETTGWAAGAQLNPSQTLALRGGVHEDAPTGTRLWTAGIGISSESGSIDYSAEIPDGETSPKTHFVSISLVAF